MSGFYIIWGSCGEWVYVHFSGRGCSRIRGKFDALNPGEQQKQERDSKQASVAENWQVEMIH